MRIIFPSWPGRRAVDMSFEPELEAARAAGFDIGFVDIELNLGGEVRLWDAGPGPAIYRGWILKVEDYERLFEGVQARGGSLIVSPEAYRYTNDFPSWYADLEGETPRSVWFKAEELRTTRSLIPTMLFNQFGAGAFILKDYVKSRKQDWFEACFIPDVRDEEAIQRTITKFLDLQGDSFVGGLVFRQFVPLKKIGTHPKSRMPLVNEWRFFLKDGRAFHKAPYWSDGADYAGLTPPDDHLVEKLLKDTAKVPFISIDLAEREDGGWVPIEIGDGGSSGVPDGSSLKDFYENLAKACRG